MPVYEISERHHIRELGRKVRPGEVIHLMEDVAERYNASHPGLLVPARRTAQGEIGAARAMGARIKDAKTEEEETVEADEAEQEAEETKKPKARKKKK